MNLMSPLLQDINCSAFSIYNHSLETLVIEIFCNLRWFFSKACPTQEDNPCIQIGEAIKGTFVQHCLQRLQTYLPQTLEGRPTLLQQTYLPQTLKRRPTLMQPIWPPATILP